MIMEDLLNERETMVTPLEEGVFYIFKPSVQATGNSVEDEVTYPPSLFSFTRVRYLGFRSGVHSFEGTPENDTREIPCHLSRGCVFSMTQKEVEKQPPIRDKDQRPF